MVLLHPLVHVPRLHRRGIVANLIFRRVHHVKVLLPRSCLWKEDNKKSHLSKDHQSLRDGSKKCCTRGTTLIAGRPGHSVRSAPPEGGESRLHDNGQRPSAPKGDASQRGCSRASDAVPSVPPCTDRRLSETGRGIAFSPSSHFGRWEEYNSSAEGRQVRKSALTADLVRFDRHLLAKRAVSCENRKKNQDGSRRPEAAASLRKTPLRKRPAPQEPGDRAGYILHPEKCPAPHSAAPVRQICVSVATMGTRRSWRPTGTRGCSRRSGHTRMAGP